jgi:lipopolysaccharide export system permease protein
MPLRLSLYIAKRLLWTTLFFFIGISVLVLIIDFLELLRKSGDSPDASALRLLLISGARVPSITEQTLPFAVLFAAIMAFLLLSRRLELVVARASGFSIWQIVLPTVLVAVLVGIAATTAFNPLSATLKEHANAEESALRRGSNGAAAPTGRRWIRQQSVDGQSVLRADASAERGTRLTGVTAFVFSKDGAFQERVESPLAILHNGYWELANARILRVNAAPEADQTYTLATSLSASQVAESLAPAETVSFWELPRVIDLSQRAGIPALRLQMQYQVLLARPALLAAMVLIAASVALGFVRTGGMAKAIVGGVGAGFVLYVVNEIVEDFGAAGFISPALAAWGPAVIGALVSVTVLLFREDG